MSSGDVEKGVTEGGGWVHPEGEMAKPSLGLAMKSPWVEQGGPFFVLEHKQT